MSGKIRKLNRSRLPAMRRIRSPSLELLSIVSAVFGLIGLSMDLISTPLTREPQGFSRGAGHLPVRLQHWASSREHVSNG
jgi:hypothetical protein